MNELALSYQAKIKGLKNIKCEFISKSWQDMHRFDVNNWKSVGKVNNFALNIEISLNQVNSHFPIELLLPVEPKPLR